MFKANFIPRKPICKFSMFSSFICFKSNLPILFRLISSSNDRLFHIVFASAMKRDYVLYPSMIASETGVLWSYDNFNVVFTFDDSHPLDVTASQCHDLAICLWYISPLWQFNDPVRTKYALLGEWNKWTAVSQQRFLSINTNAQKTQTTITLQGAAAEIVPVVIYHSKLRSVTVPCSISAANGQATLVITPTNVMCS
jgi:hypothetical protein